jgi:hypothetical protein
MQHDGWKRDDTRVEIMLEHRETFTSPALVRLLLVIQRLFYPLPKILYKQSRQRGTNYFTSLVLPRALDLITIFSSLTPACMPICVRSEPSDCQCHGAVRMECVARGIREVRIPGIRTFTGNTKSSSSIMSLHQTRWRKVNSVHVSSSGSPEKQARKSGLVCVQTARSCERPGKKEKSAAGIKLRLWPGIVAGKSKNDENESRKFSQRFNSQECTHEQDGRRLE